MRDWGGGHRGFSSRDVAEAQAWAREAICFMQQLDRLAEQRIKAATAAPFEPTPHPSRKWLGDIATRKGGST